MSKDGTISIAIEVDGKEIDVASKSLDKLEDSGNRSGKGIKSAESSVESLADSSAKASKDVKGAADSVDGLADSGSKASKDLKGADSAIDGIADSSSSAAKDVKGTADSLDDLAYSGAKVSKDLNGADSAIDGMSDSSVEASKGVKGAADSLDGMSDSASGAASAAKKAGDETKGVGDEAEKASNNTKKFAVSLGLIAIASAAFVTLKSSMDDAITRFDTLATFPKVLQELGVSAEESERAMSNLSDGIDGLPTKLNDIAANAQRMYSSFNDMDKATDAALALNNALLGSGSSAVEAQRGTDQYIKALQTGKMDMNTWNTLSETMDIGLIKIAEGFGFAGKSAKNDLYNALQDTSISMDDFTDKLIEVGTGTGIMAQLAKENSIGIATSLGNLQNAAARGIADIIDSFNKLSQTVTGKDIAQNIDGLKAVVNASFKAIGWVIEGTTPVIIFFADGVKATIPIVNALTPAIIGLMAAYAAYTVIGKVTGIIQASNAVLTAAQASQSALTLAVTASTAAQARQTGAITASNLVIGVMTGRITLATAATIAKTAATYAWGAALRFLAGPVGWIVAGIGLLVTGVIAVVKWFNKSSEEADRLNAETEKLGESVDSLTSSVGSNASAYKEQQTSIEATAKANSDLAIKIEELSEKENKSAAEKHMLASYVDQLNESVEGLNLTYSAEADALSMSSEELQGRVDLMEKQTSYNEALERQVEIAKEQHEIDSKLSEINELREEWLEKMENGEIKSKEYAAALADLTEQEDGLKEANVELAEQYQLTEEQMVTSMDTITEATQNGITNQIIAFEDLSESQQATVESMKSTWEDYKSAATDMFNALSEEATVTVAEMAANLEENQRIIGEWATNIATLAERGVDEGLLNTLREAGPESAGHVNALVNASDEELQRLSSAFADGGDVATDALSKSLGIEESGVMEAVGHLVSDTESTLKEQINAADFKSIGGDVATGLAQGIEGGSKDAENASKNMADDTTKAAKAALDSHSPSRVFKQIGTDITDGLVLGIDGGAGKVTQAIQKMFQSVQANSKRSFDNIIKDYNNAVNQIEKSLEKLPKATEKHMSSALKALEASAKTQITTMETLSKDYDARIIDIETSMQKLPVIAQKSMEEMLGRLRKGADSNVKLMQALAVDLLKPFNNTKSQFNSIGLSAMDGLNAGLLAGRSQVLSTARGIANGIRQTMQSALDINSPSRVMRDEVGRWIPEGIALGIKENAEMVYKELEALSTGMIVPSTPEQALGASRMAYNGHGGVNGGNAFTTNNDKSKKMENKIEIHTNDSGVKEMERAFRRLQFGL